jgi:hypothetical protein
MGNPETIGRKPVLPRDCQFAESDWLALAPFWYLVAFSHEVKDKPFAVTLLDERLVVFRVAGRVTAARDLCLHRGAPLSAGRIEDEGQRKMVDGEWPMGDGLTGFLSTSGKWLVWTGVDGELPAQGRVRDPSTGSG